MSATDTADTNAAQSGSNGGETASDSPQIITQALNAPSKYIQGRGVIALIGQHVADLGKKALVLADENVWGFVEDGLTKSLREAHVELIKEVFCGECSDREIDRVGSVMRSQGADVVVGIGGGKTLDAAKAIGYKAGVTWASVPTVASTDAPTSALSVIYTDDGVFQEYMILPRNPDLVLVDTALAANAPFRFLVSGMGDALATWVEAKAAAEARKSAMAGGLPTMAALSLAKLCWDTLIDYGYLAKQAAERHVVTPALEKTVEANTLLSGLGFESGGLAAAHAVHNGLTAVPDTHHYMHGEKVNIGTLTQFMLEDRPTVEVGEFLSFCREVGLPTTLADVGLGDAGTEELMTVAEAATVPGETIHNMPFPVTPQMVYDAIVAADATARAFQHAERQAAGAP